MNPPPSGIVESRAVRAFDITRSRPPGGVRQTTEHYEFALRQAVTKRLKHGHAKSSVLNGRSDACLALSSGYDSGAVGLAMALTALDEEEDRQDELTKAKEIDQGARIAHRHLYHILDSQDDLDTVLR